MSVSTWYPDESSSGTTTTGPASPAKAVDNDGDATSRKHNPTGTDGRAAATAEAIDASVAAPTEDAVPCAASNSVGLDESMASTRFSEVTALVEAGPGRFTADVHPNWTIGGKPNGGYLLALLGRAAAIVGPHPHVIAASAHYLASPVPGPVTVCAEVLRAGRSASQLRAWMAQNGRPTVEALITTSTLEENTEPYWSGGVPQTTISDAEQCVRVPPTSPTGLEVTIMGEVDLRIDPATLSFATGKPSGNGELRGTLELPGGESFDPTSLLYALDAFPPATFEVALSGWVPTLELTTYVRALPAPGPLKVLHRAGMIEAQRVDEACFVWDSRGRLVAQATQLAGLRVG